MKTIHKVQLTIIQSQNIELPNDAEILHMAVQHELPCIWYITDPDRDNPTTTTHKVWCYSTGHPAPDARIGDHIGTLLFNNSTFVFHFFASTK